MNIVFLGPPGAGKGTIAAKTSEVLSIPHISTGDIFRDHIKRQTELGKKVKSILESGELIPDSLTTDLVESRLAAKDTARGYILDGYPRTLVQTKWLDAHQNITHYIVFKIHQKIVIERLSGRRVHPASGRTYHILHNPPRLQDTDDMTGEALVQRDDDGPEKIVTRLAVYQDQTVPIISFLENKPNFTCIDAGKPAEEVLQSVLRVLKQQP